jgi:hypothetical protein
VSAEGLGGRWRVIDFGPGGVLIKGCGKNPGVYKRVPAERLKMRPEIVPEKRRPIKR